MDRIDIAKEIIDQYPERIIKSSPWPDKEIKLLSLTYFPNFMIVGWIQYTNDVHGNFVHIDIKNKDFSSFTDAVSDYYGFKRCVIYEVTNDTTGYKGYKYLFLMD